MVASKEIASYVEELAGAPLDSIVHLYRRFLDDANQGLLAHEDDAGRLRVFADVMTYDACIIGFMSGDEDRQLAAVVQGEFFDRMSERLGSYIAHLLPAAPKVDEDAVENAYVAERRTLAVLTMSRERDEHACVTVWWSPFLSKTQAIALLKEALEDDAPDA